MEITNSGGVTYEIYYISGGNGLNNIIVNQNGTISIYYIYTDQLGSILSVTNEAGTVVAEQNFDAWGRKRNPVNWTYSGIPTVPNWLYRGFTGHEHIMQFTLINMNGRMYDPMTGMMMSPDNYIPMPWSPGGYNRYNYAYGNPLKFIDPDGEFAVVDSWVGGFFRGLFKGGLKEGWKEANKSAANDLKIWGGLFTTDPNKTFFGKVWEVFSRFTWQAPQEIAGFALSHFRNTIMGDVERVDYRFGTTVLQGRSDHVFSKNTLGFTLGNYINGNNTIQADPNNSLFQHEYGHYIQSQAVGPMYLGKYALPAAWFSKNGTDSRLHPGEQDANSRALQYFHKNISNYGGWRFDENPIRNYNDRLLYNDPSNQQALKDAILKPAWFDYFFIPSSFTIVGAIFPSIVNALLLNSQY